MNGEYRNIDTARPDGCYVTFHRIERTDSDADPREYLFQDPDCREADQARLDAWRRGEWHFIGIQAQAAVWIVRHGVGTRYALTSPGLWAVESDSDADYLASVYADERAMLLDDIAAMGAPVIDLHGPEGV
jgi:hypothetical protein